MNSEEVIDGLRSQIEQLKADLKDAEESAIRSLNIRDEVVKENDELRRIANEAITKAVSTHPFFKYEQRKAKAAEERERTVRLELETAKLEIRLLKKQAKLLKAHKEAS